MEVSGILNYPIQIKKTAQSNISKVDFDNIPFGKVFTDHMFVVDYSDGEWRNPEIVPLAPIPLHPAISGLHYGQEIFEGMKAFKNDHGDPMLFRPQMNIKRFNRSARRMAMPEIPEELFYDALVQLVRIDKNWIPKKYGTALYVRPFMFGTDAFIGVKPSTSFKFMIICCPVDVYYPKPVKVVVAENYVRAFKGGTGNAKAAGNYGAAMLPQVMARDLGYDQVLWTDGVEYKYVQEIGTMNVFFVIDDVVITAPTDDGTILEGVTRDSVLTLLNEKGIKNEVRQLSIDEIIEAHKKGKLQEAFGTGTAASISFISDIMYLQKNYELPDTGSFKVANWLKKELDDIKCGRTDDRFGWMENLAL